MSEGTYVFDAATGRLTDSAVAEVGTFSAAALLGPIAPGAFAGEASAEIPCVEVVNSEIMVEIQNPENAGAVFVLPSQINGAEYPSQAGIVQDIDAYKFDNTGGPRGQLAVHPAAGQFVLDNAAREQRELGINSMGEVLKLTNDAISAAGVTRCAFKLLNGYLKLPQPGTSDAAATALSALQRHAHLSRPLLMAGVSACGLRPDKADFSPGGHVVNLVYASAVPINSYVNGIGAVSPGFSDEELRRFQLACSETLLLVHYLAALKAAAALPGQERRRVFLMPLGGGAFKNPWPSIVKAMSLAVELLGDDLRGRLDIRALAFLGGTAGKSDPTPEHVKLAELLEVQRKLRR